MSGLHVTENKNKAAFIAAIILMVLAAFIQCYRTTSDLHWFYDTDFYRDMSYVQGALDGKFGKDPNYAGAYLWYNPMLSSIETLIVKITGLPVNIVLARAGVYLNLLGPLAFVLMLTVLFDLRMALACLLSYLFLASGNIPGFDAATYSPWLYPVCFAQFIFYLNIILCYKAFSTQKYLWFVILGCAAGIGFLAHTAPTVLIILIMASVQTGNIAKALRSRDYQLFKKYIFQGLAAFIPFIIASLPLLFFIVGKYHLHFLNRMPFEYVDSIFDWHNFTVLIRENVSVSFLISIVGFVWFYKNFKHVLIRKIILSWFFISIIMFIYSTIVASADRHFNIHLPGTVPSFHYFFYLKAVQSVFFGFGFIFLISPLVRWAEGFISIKVNSLNDVLKANQLFIILVILCSIIYFPFYQNRQDFVFFHAQNLAQENEKDKIEMYQYIVQNIPSDKVILCEEGDPSLFPVMATARKMVSIGITYSNPYLDFERRETDRNNMILFLKTGQPFTAKQLFDNYQVSFVLLSNKELGNYKSTSLLKQIIFKNNTYTMLTFDGLSLNSADREGSETVLSAETE